jgi:hypothetical protein
MLGCSGPLSAQQKTVFPFASAQSRNAVTNNLKATIASTITVPLHDSNDRRWMSAYWAMELLLYKPIGYDALIASQIPELPAMKADFQRAFLEMLFTLYPKQFARELSAVWKALATDKVKAMALEYLSASGTPIAIDANSAFAQSEYYQSFRYNLHKGAAPLPSKKDFLDASFLPGQMVLVSCQSRNRNMPGYLLMRMPNGSWMKDANGAVLQYPQLARSISNLPFYLTNGNTPQGLYKITGYDTSDNNWIGPTTNLQMILPFENNPADFFGEETDYEAAYRNLLGSKLRSYEGLWESYLAGKSGRSEIIAHGTTIDPAYYAGQSYYPCTPSLGCLCSPEIWNENGERVYSAQDRWVRVVRNLVPQPVYLLVVEVGDL